MARFLAMTKLLGGIHPIIMGKHYINSQALFYAFIFMMLLQHISPYIN
jgi:hypothetical protein